MNKEGVKKNLVELKRQWVLLHHLNNTLCIIHVVQVHIHENNVEPVLKTGLELGMY